MRRKIPKNIVGRFFGITLSIAFLTLLIVLMTVDLAHPYTLAWGVYLTQCFSAAWIISLSLALFLLSESDAWVVASAALTVAWSTGVQISWASYSAPKFDFSIAEYEWAFGLLTFCGLLIRRPTYNLAKLNSIHSLPVITRLLFVLSSAFTLLAIAFVSGMSREKWFWYFGVWSVSEIAISAVFSIILKHKIDGFLLDLSALLTPDRCPIDKDATKLRVPPKFRPSELEHTLKTVFQAKISEARASAGVEAVARMTQMLAHDVRKPFSILRMGLGMLRNAKDPAGMKRILASVVPEIDKAVSSVDGLIADVMEVGSTSSQLIQEPASPESLIETTLSEIFRIYPRSDVAVSYDLQHLHMVNVHVQKIGRVLSNIIGNAIQAMNYKGQIWFKTCELDGLVEFCLGNAGSVIPPESLPKLFDAFFTSGKKGGTGLGLAIVHKVVTAHGGRIWCESLKTLEHPDGKVEFYFTLPIAEGHRFTSTASLPRHSSEFTQALQAFTDLSDGDGANVDKGELILEADIVQACERQGRPLRVLVVDDENIYRSALASYLDRTSDLGHALTVVPAADSVAALAAAEAQNFDLVITDVDMGPGSLDGFELVQALRAKGMKAMICVHSNRIVAADHQTAFGAGADAFLPKPMARAQLLRLVLQAAERVKEQEIV